MGKKKEFKLDSSRPLTEEEKAEWKKFMEENKDKFPEVKNQEDDNLTPMERLQRAQDAFEVLKLWHEHYDDDCMKYEN